MFSTVGCLHTLEPDQRRAYVLELSRVLKPGAWYHLFCFQRLSPAPPDPEQRRFFLKGDLEALLDPTLCHRPGNRWTNSPRTGGTAHGG